VLHADDLPEPELIAALLDGEVFAVGSGFGPVDAVDSPSLRAAALAHAAAPRLVVERRSAAWVWGARDAPPPVAQLCSPADARYRRIGGAGSATREVVLRHGDTVVLAGTTVTAPLRTAVDLARVEPGYGPDDAESIARLASTARFGLEDCERVLDRVRNLPGKRRALLRLRATLPG